MKHLRYLVMLALVAMPLVACDDDDDGGQDPVVTITGTVAGTVSIEGTGVAGVNVALVGATSQTATTGSGGAYSFANVEAGSYGVTISNIPADATFSTTSATTAITTAGQTVTVDFAGNYIRTSSISGQVMAGGEGVAGVSVTATGPEGASNAVTDSGGNYSFSGLRAGNYTVALANIPADFTFAVMSNQVTLGTGEAKSVSFFGEKVNVTDPVTATVLIKSVTAGLTNAPVNPAAVAGQIDVTVQVDPGTNSLTKLCVLIDGAEVPNGCQVLSSAVFGDNVRMLQGGQFEVIFSILTGAFDGTTGTPSWMNGPHTLSAQVDLANAEAAKVETSMSLTFANADRLISTWTFEKTMVGLDAKNWRAGDIGQTVLPVLFSGGEIAQMGFTVNDACGGGAPLTRTITAAPWGHTYPDNRDPDQTSSGGPGTDGCEHAALPFVVNTVMVGGATGPTATWTFPVDDVAPTFNDMHDLILSTRWINENHTFAVEPASGAWPDLIENGVGYQGDVLFECGTSSSTLAPCTSGADLSESFDNNEYLIRVTATDLIGNARVMYYAGTTDDDGEYYSSNADYFGVDHGDPTMTQVTSAPALRNMDKIWTGADVPAATTPRTTASVSYSDALSGFSVDPVDTRIRRYTPTVSGTSSSGCFLGSWSSSYATCYMIGTAGSIDITTYPPDNGSYTDGYYRIEMETYDQANNPSGELEWWNVRDATAPVNGGVTNDADLDPGTLETFQALVVDNLDLNQGIWFLNYNDGATDHRIHQGTNAIGAWGADEFTTSATASITTNFVGNVEWGIGGVDGPADAMILDVYDFGHTGASSATGVIGAENPWTLAAPTSFGAGTADVQLTGATFNAVNYGAGNTGLCADLDGDGCTVATSATSATLSIAVTGAGSNVGAPAPLLNQFQTVTFYARMVDDADVTDPFGGATDTWYKIGTGVVSVTEDAPGNVRTYTYSGVIQGSQFSDSGTFTLLALGVNADGRALAFPLAGGLNVVID